MNETISQAVQALDNLSALIEMAAKTCKRTETGRPVLSWTLIVRGASKTLEACLKSLRAMTPQAEIVIVDTMSNDEGATWAIAARYADVLVEYNGPNGTWTREMYAFDDAAAARNRALELATGQWVGWIDADDELLPPEDTQKLLAVNGYLQRTGITEVKGLETTKESTENLPSRTVASLEDFLAAIAKHEPGVTCFSCPYLYRFALGDEGEKGKADEWQIRERFIKVGEGDVLGWRWHRKAHEYLAPDNTSEFAGVRQLKSLLFVHRKSWTEEDMEYSIKRHYAIVRADYDAGKRNYFDLHYLVRYASKMCPDDLPRFMDELLGCAFTNNDRAHAHTTRGRWQLSRGLVQEALESFVCATVCDPSYPDAYFALAFVFKEQDRCGKAVDWFMKGVKLAPDHVWSALTPKQHLVVNRLEGAVCAHLAAKTDPTNTEMYLRAAAELAEDAAREPGADIIDASELQSYVHLFQNELKCFQALRAMSQIADVLAANDETLKAARLAELIPHNMTDHPLAQHMLAFKAKLDRHANVPAAYAEFYEGELETGEFGNFATFKAMKKLPRVEFLCEQLRLLNANLGRPLRVLEVGPWDGPALLPAMETCPDSQFVVIEVQQKAIDQLLKNAKERGIDNRLRVVHGMLGESTMREAVGADVFTPTTGATRSADYGFDAIIFFEVLEHLPDTKPSLRLLKSALRPAGRLFVSTPWGAYDRGFPANMEVRDPRGHVTAMMPRDVVQALSDVGMRTLELGGSHFEGNFSDTIHAMAELGPLQKMVPVTRHDTIDAELERGGRSPQFVVSQSLWPWNATHVENTGIGASEETIVYLARELGRRGGRPEVYGPIPMAGTLEDVEVRDGVAYWPKEQIRHLDPDRPVIVSRAPGYFAGTVKPVLERFNKRVRRAFLWLQDCTYPDLNEKNVADYEKVVVLSKKHQVQICAQGVALEKTVIIPNFLLRQHFPQVPSKCGGQRELHRFIYASSPDRGLIPLLKIWPRIRAKWPDATLGVFYGWQGAAKLGSAGSAAWLQMYRQLRAQWDELKRQPGVEEHGRVNHQQIAFEMRRASVWAYPLFNPMVETFCSNAIKARAAGCVPVVTRGMIPEEALFGGVSYKSLAELVDPPKNASSFMVDPGEEYGWNFLKACDRAINRTEDERDAMAIEAIEQFELGAVLPKWEELLR